jgi:hypothetical protein
MPIGDQSNDRRRHAMSTAHIFAILLAADRSPHLVCSRNRAGTAPGLDGSRCRAAIFRTLASLSTSRHRHAPRRSRFRPELPPQFTFVELSSRGSHAPAEEHAFAPGARGSIHPES